MADFQSSYGTISPVTAYEILSDSTVSRNSSLKERTAVLIERRKGKFTTGMVKRV
jgi:hypothetical protein